MEHASDTATRTHRPLLGIGQWFHFEEHKTLERTVGLMHDLGLRRIRTGISWADYYRPGGKAWYDRQMRALEGLDVLLSIWHTPPSISETVDGVGACANPPRRLQDYADFIDLMIAEHGDRFNDIELWNEPNNRYKWDFNRFDPKWEKFGTMVGMAGHWARQRGKRTVLGGMIPVDPHWLDLMRGYGVLDVVDVVAIHGFPEMWWEDAPNWDWHSHWRGWEEKIASIAPQTAGKPVWITETGLATWDLGAGARARHDLQVAKLEEAARAPAERVYWYSMIDLDPARAAIEGFHVDENEYHLGLVTWEGEKKPAYFRMKELVAEAARARKSGRTA